MADDGERFQLITNEIAELKELLGVFSERENAHYTDVMLLLKTIVEKSETAELLGDDELFETAKELVVAAGQASTSFLQRALGIGYARAASLIDKLEADGVIGPAEGVKPRKVNKLKED